MTRRCQLPSATFLQSHTWKDDINDTTLFDQTCLHLAKGCQLFQSKHYAERSTYGKGNMIIEKEADFIHLHFGRQ